MGQHRRGRSAKDSMIQIMRRTNWTVYDETDEGQQDDYGGLQIYIWTK